MATRLTNNPLEANAISHAGNFHADDIMSIVFLKKLRNNIVLYRSLNNIPENIGQDVIVFDTGYGKFDHHQKGGNGTHPIESSTSEKPIPYASFGLLWKEFGLEFCSQKFADSDKATALWKYMENELVKSVDAFDNGIYPRCNPEYSYKLLTVSNLIALINPTVTEGEDYDSYIDIAISVAEIIFDTILKIGINNIEKFHKNGSLQMDNSSLVDQSEYFNAQNIFVESLKRRLSKDSTSVSSHELEKKFHISDNGTKAVPMSEFGMLWEKYGKDYCNNITSDEVCSTYVWNYLNTNLVIGLDASIAGIQAVTMPGYTEYPINTLYDFIGKLNVHGISAQKTASNLAALVFDRILHKAIDRINSKDYVERKIQESFENNCNDFTKSSRHILVLDKHVHWQDWVAKSPKAKEIWFVVTPSNQGGFIVRPVPCQYKSNGYRKGFPKNWHGYSGNELKKITGVRDATFVHHSNGFIAGASSLHGAILLAKRSFSHNECYKTKNPSI